MAAQWIARGTVARLKWIDDGNMAMVLVSYIDFTQEAWTELVQILNAVLFATCFKMCKKP